MATFWDRSTRDELCKRVERLTPAHTPAWGKMNVTQMMAHLNDALRMASGELQTTAKNTPFRRWPIKQLIVYVMPWPKGAPTAPELLARSDNLNLQLEQAEFRVLADRLATKAPTDSWPEHPAFGSLTHKAWGVLKYRHTDHHLRQFRV